MREPAPEPSRALALPRQGLGDVSSHLADFVITTWHVDPAALAAHLPEGLEPDVFTLDDGRERAFVSAVSFLNTEFYVGFAPFLKLRCRQVNYRAYVRRRDERAAFFFGTSLSTRWVFIPRHVWRLPWAFAAGRHEARWRDDQLERLEWSATGRLGEETLSLRGPGEPLARLDGFQDLEETHEVLTSPTIGYLFRRGGTPATYSIWHAPLEMRRVEPERARFEYFERLGLVDAGVAPHSVLTQRVTHYLIFLPPKRAAGLGTRSVDARR